MFCLVTVGACTVSGLRAQIDASNQRVREVEAVRTQLASQYQAEGQAAIQGATTIVEAQSSLASVRQRWSALWGTCNDATPGPNRACHDGAWPTLVAAQDAWASTMERAQQSTPDVGSVQQAAESLRRAYCGVESALPSGVTPPPSVHTACTDRP